MVNERVFDWSITNSSGTDEEFTGTTQGLIDWLNSRKAIGGPGGDIKVVAGLSPGEDMPSELDKLIQNVKAFGINFKS